MINYQKMKQKNCNKNLVRIIKKKSRTTCFPRQSPIQVLASPDRA